MPSGPPSRSRTYRCKAVQLQVSATLRVSPHDHEGEGSDPPLYARSLCLKSNVLRTIANICAAFILLAVGRIFLSYTTLRLGCPLAPIFHTHVMLSARLSPTVSSAPTSTCGPATRGDARASQRREIHNTQGVVAVVAVVDRTRLACPSLHPVCAPLRRAAGLRAQFQVRQSRLLKAPRFRPRRSS